MANRTQAEVEMLLIKLANNPTANITNGGQTLNIKAAGKVMAIARGNAQKAQSSSGGIR